MRREFTAVYEQDDGWFIGYCPEIPGANGQGETIEECRESLRDAIALILEDRGESLDENLRQRLDEFDRDPSVGIPAYEAIASLRAKLSKSH